MNRLQTLVFEAYREIGPMTARTAQRLERFREYASNTVPGRISELAAVGSLVAVGKDETRRRPMTIWEANPLPPSIDPRRRASSSPQSRRRALAQRVQMALRLESESGQPKTVSQLADVAGTSRTSFDRARQVLNSSNEKVKAAMLAGVIPIHTAMRKLNTKRKRSVLSLSSKRGLAIAKKNLKRLNIAIAKVAGVCEALDEINLGATALVAQAEACDDWYGSLQTCLSKLETLCATINHWRSKK